MSANSKIEWTDDSWNPIRARRTVMKDGELVTRIGWHCEHASEGCRFCYAETLNKGRFGNGADYKPGNLHPRGSVQLFLDETVLMRALSWRRPRKVFVCSMTDLFADFVPDEWLDRIFGAMALCPHITFQVLTKRIGRARDYLNSRVETRAALGIPGWPLRNVWLGCTVEDQPTADSRREPLREAPAAVKFVSYEPALGPVDWTGWEFVDQIISGGESGPKARPSHPDWHRATRDFGAASGIAYFFKQWGAWAPRSGTVWAEWVMSDGSRHSGGFDTRQHLESVLPRCSCGIERVGKKAAGRLLDGVTHDAFPQPIKAGAAS